MIVVYSASRNLYPYLLPSVMSLLKHNPQTKKVYLLIEDDHLPYEIPEVCECVNVSKYKEMFIGGKNFHTPYSYLSLIRACYNKVLPRKHDRIIQLDVDTIIEDSLKPLWDIDLTGKWFAAAPELKGSYRPYGSPYYNAGVMVLNLKQIRKDGIEDIMVADLNANRFQQIDQDTWNKYGAVDKAVPFDTRYNECFVTGTSMNPAVVHFAGTRNWWRYKEGFRGYYLENYKEFFREGCNS